VPDLTAEAARRLAEQVLTGLDVPAAEAAVQAAALVEADLRGHPSHGLIRLPRLVERIRNKVIVAGAGLDLVWRTGSAVTVDGRRGLGPVVAHRVLDAVLPRVRETGIVVAAIRRANHLGILAPYVERVAREGLVAIATTTSEALVHPWNGRTAQVGTNPLAVGVPTGGEPFVLDMATGLVSMGRILEYASRGAALPEGWALDADGEPTTDPVAAERGSIAPFGGPKGYALGLALELLVATLTGTALGTDVHGTLDGHQEAGKGDVFIVLDPAVLGGDGAGVDRYLAQVRADGSPERPVLVPGDRARQVRAERLRTGITVPESLWARLSVLLDGDPA
jgi:L-2-hydroxycarboxylate dehydrogenase (NAD+)